MVAFIRHIFNAGSVGGRRRLGPRSGTDGALEHPDLNSQSSQYARSRGLDSYKLVFLKVIERRSDDRRVRGPLVPRIDGCPTQLLDSWPLANARRRSPAASSLPRSPTRRDLSRITDYPGGGSTSSTASEHRSWICSLDPGRSHRPHPDGVWGDPEPARSRLVANGETVVPALPAGGGQRPWRIGGSCA